MAAQGFRVAAARLPIIRLIARKRARQAFDLVAGFTYSQVLLAAVEAKLLDMLADGPLDASAIAARCGLSEAAACRLINAMTALDLAEQVARGQWMLGQQGAVIHADRGVQAMIRHHRLLYAELGDPLALFRQDRARPTAVSNFWTYARAGDATGESAAPYSELMAASHGMVGQEVLDAYDFSRHDAVLDVGGGFGAFATALAAKCQRPRLGIFDLPEVVRESASIVSEAPLAGRCTLHPGDFFRDSLPQGYDCITLLRILHDHDDEPALRLLTAIRHALPPGGRLVIAEPMDGTPGAAAMAAYFTLYLWAMGSGRPRTATEIGTMLHSAGFASWRLLATRQPLVTSLIVARL